MKVPCELRPMVWLIAGGGLLMAPGAATHASDVIDGITAVASKVSADYIRTKSADGSFESETYAFGEGGHFGGPMHDNSIDNLKFIDVARALSTSLAEQHYVPNGDPRKTKLLIMVYWGLTNAELNTGSSIGYQSLQIANAAYREAAPNGSWGEGKDPPAGVTEQLNEALEIVALVNRQKEETDRRNAQMLGYEFGEPDGPQFQPGLNGIAQRLLKEDLVLEVEENRYFVVLMAYDFELLWKQKKHKELWETRFSIRQRRNDFEKDLPVMARYASQYFGRDSKGLVRTRVPEGNVEVHEPSLIEFVNEPKK
jgi:hypothetical protein